MSKQSVKFKNEIHIYMPMSPENPKIGSPLNYLKSQQITKSSSERTINTNISPLANNSIQSKKIEKNRLNKGIILKNIQFGENDLNPKHSNHDIKFKEKFIRPVQADRNNAGFGGDLNKIEQKQENFEDSQKKNHKFQQKKGSIPDFRKFPSLKAKSKTSIKQKEQIYHKKSKKRNTGEGESVPRKQPEKNYFKANDYKKEAHENISPSHLHSTTVNNSLISNACQKALEEKLEIINNINREQEFNETKRRNTGLYQNLKKPSGFFFDEEPKQYIEEVVITNSIKKSETCRKINRKQIQTTIFEPFSEITPSTPQSKHNSNHQKTQNYSVKPHKKFFFRDYQSRETSKNNSLNRFSDVKIIDITIQDHQQGHFPHKPKFLCFKASKHPQSPKVPNPLLPLLNQ